MATMNVSLPQEMKDWVEDLARSGDYANSSDVIRDLIREEIRREQARDEFDRRVQDAIDSGISSSTPEEILARGRARAEAALKKRA